MDSRAQSERQGDYETAASADDHLDVRVWLRLLTCTNMIEGAVRRNLRTDYEFTLPRFDLLAQLDRAEAGLTMGELSRRLMVSNGNVTGLIDRLVGEGLVARKPAPEDRRAQLVTLTPAGRKVFDAMWPEHQRWINSLLEGLDRAETKALFALLGKLKKSLSAGGTGAQLRQGER